MCSIILYQNEGLIQAFKMERTEDAIFINAVKYIYENLYFADWIPLRNHDKQIIGFKIIPFANDEYLNKHILSCDFIKFAKNITLEKKQTYTYILVFLVKSQLYEEDTVQFIEAAIFRDQQDDFILRLDGFREEDWNLIGFDLKLYKPTDT